MWFWCFGGYRFLSFFPNRGFASKGSHFGSRRGYRETITKREATSSPHGRRSQLLFWNSSRILTKMKNYIMKRRPLKIFTGQTHGFGTFVKSHTGREFFFGWFSALLRVFENSWPNSCHWTFFHMNRRVWHFGSNLQLVLKMWSNRWPIIF